MFDFRTRRRGRRLCECLQQTSMRATIRRSLTTWWLGHTRQTSNTSGNFLFFTVLRIRIRDLVPFWPLDPGSGKKTQTRNPYFLELSDNFLVKKFYNSLKIGPNFFLRHFKNKIIYNVVKFMATIKVWQLIFLPLPFVAVFGSGIRDV